MSGDQVAELPAPPLFVACVGRKGQGKSELSYQLWDSWPGDRICIDTTGDFVNGSDPAKTHLEEDTVDVDIPPPARWPSHLKEAEAERLSLRYVPDHAAADYVDDMDRAVGLAFSHGDCLLLIEETGLVAPAGSVRPHTRKALHMGRHQNLSVIMNMPRTMGVDPLCLAQADVIYAFDLPNPDDRKRLADIIGFDRQLVDDGISALGDHEYLRFVVKDHELSHWPPLPLRRRRRHAQAHLEGDYADAQI